MSDILAKLKAWWYNPFLKWYDQHPLAHALGGIVVAVAARLLWWPAGGYHVVLFVAFVQGFWELAQGEFIPGYPIYSGVLDVLMAVLTGWLVSVR